MRGLSRKSVRAPRIMADVYRSLLTSLERRGWAAPRQTVRVGRPQIAWILLRTAVF
jgi:phytoene synthase